MPDRVPLPLVLTALLTFTATLSAAETPPFHLLEAGIEDVQSAFKSGRFTCRDLTQFYLKRIAAYDKSGPILNAVQTVNADALREAEALDAAWRASGPVGPLHCIPVLIKDQVETNGLTTTYGSAVFQNFVPNRDATVVLRLKRAGAIILGKTTMGEYASGYAGSAFGIIRNAYDPRRSPSGSSGGTGSAIAANFATVGIGEDTGGSIRGPAAVSSLVGLRPTVPLVSRFGMLPAKPSSDTLGPIARTVTDAAIVLGVIAGYDPNDAVTAYSVGHVPDSYTSFLRRDGLKGARIGVIREPMDPKADPTSADYKQVRSVIEKAKIGRAHV
jgi:amidase